MYLKTSPGKCRGMFLMGALDSYFAPAVCNRDAISVYFFCWAKAKGRILTNYSVSES